MVQFAGHLHVHDEYSLLDGSANRNQLTYEAVTKGQTNLGLTNHGRLAGALEHVHACRHPEAYENPLEPGVKRSANERMIPILGIEAFYRPDRFMDLTDQSLYGKNGHNWAQHLCIHAGNLAGWRTLLRLSAKSWVSRESGGGHYGKAVIDLDMLKNDNEGLVISTACISSPLAYYILAGDERGAKKWVQEMRKIAPVWFELMPHDLDAQRDYNIGLINLAYEMNAPLVASGDVHTPYKRWMNTQSLIRMISYRQTVSDQKAKKDAGEDVYTDEINSVFLSSGDEMYRMFKDNHPDIPDSVVREALANTHDFFSSFKPYAFGRSLKMPHVDVDSKQVVWGWVQEGLKRLKDEYPAEHWKRFPFEEYEQRLKEEWDVLVAKDVIDYFYIVGDFVRWARSDKPLPIRMGKRVVFPKGQRKQPILLNLRGSAAGCLISYLIDISAVDPIGHELLFERFLNPDREGMPDIDIDFESGELGRDLVKEYLRVMYGRRNVADVIAYQTFGPRAVIRAVAEVYEFDKEHFLELKKITESIGDTERGLEKIAAKNELVKKFKGDHPDWWEQMLRLEDQIKNDSRHASAIIVTDKPITETGMALQTTADRNTLITAWSDRVEFPIVSMFGWQKFDLLGVNSLNKQKLAVQLVKKFYGDDVDLNKLPVMRDPRAVDPKVMRNFKKKRTFDVFQFAGRGITDALAHIAPDDVDELSLANALYRPGASSQIDEYVKRKRGESKYTLWHEAVKPYLGRTFGIIAFQEQVMQVCKAIGGFTGAQADFMRKVVSKLYRLGKEEAQKQMQPFWEIWHAGCQKVGIPQKLIAEIWALILEFGGYSFNKAHSTSYALQAYQDMWLKTYYPLAYYAAALTITKKQKREEQASFLKEGLREARLFGIEALPPDVNKSDVGWSIEDGNLRYGLGSVAEIGWAAAQAITDARPYKSFLDFVQRMPEGTNKKHHLSLVKGGAFDSVEDREFLLGTVRMWEGNEVKYDVEFDCGCTRKKTIKMTPKQLDALEVVHRKEATSEERWKAFISDLLHEKAEEALERMSCGKHEGSRPVNWTERFDTYTVAEWMRDRPGYVPHDYDPPSSSDIAAAEREALTIGMSNGSVAIRYYDFIDERIMTEEEVAQRPRQPRRKTVKGKKMHGSRCGCKECEASEVIVGGEITRLSPIKTKNGDPMAFATMVHGDSTYELTIFTHVYAREHKVLKEPTAFMVRGNKNDRGQITVNEIYDVVEVAEDSGWEPPPISSPKTNVIPIKTGRSIRAKRRARKAA